MSIGVILGGLAVEVVKEAAEWAIDQLRERAARKGLLVDEATLKLAIRAELSALVIATEGILAAFTPLPEELRTVPPLDIAVEQVSSWVCETCGEVFEHLADRDAHIAAHETKPE